jgi:hypothetical protein
MRCSPGRGPRGPFVSDDVLPELGVGRQHASVEYEVDEGLWDLGREALHELDGFELQVCGAIAPTGLELEEESSVGEVL